MVDVPFRATFRGGYADDHLLPAYDGYNALAGLSLSLSMVTNYVETGVIRHRGAFPGRLAVKTGPIEEGSVSSALIVALPAAVLIGGALIQGDEVKRVLYDIFKRTIDRNLGLPVEPETDTLRRLENTHGGDLEALVAAIEPSVRQSHSVIGEGVQTLNVYGGRNRVTQYNVETKAYVEGAIEDNRARDDEFSVSSFNVNTGYGRVFDADVGRVVPFKVNRGALDSTKAVLSWGLNEYANGTGRKVLIRYTVLNALDGTPKRYYILDASYPG